MSVDEVIPPASNSLQSMIQRDPSLKSVEVPEIHRQMDAAIGANNEVAAAAVMHPKVIRLPSQFERGQLVYDTEKMLKVTVVKLNIGQTNKGTVLHRVGVGRTGESWIQLETRLKKLR